MTRLRVKHFGPIRNGVKNNGWIEFKRVTVFVGNQGSGKSTLAKLYSTFSWIEKALVRGDYDFKWFERKNKFIKPYLTYHRLENYLSAETEIEYEGEAYAIKYLRGQLHISELTGKKYHLPQIMYVPAERNFIAYVRHPRELKLSSDSLKEFLTEFDAAKANIKGSLLLPINQAELEYDKLNDILNIRESDYKLRLADASSGFQSAVPLHLVSHYLANTVEERSEERPETMSTDELDRFRKEVMEIFSVETLTEEQRRIALSALSSRFNKTAFINIVEEPEQNLYPRSQWGVLQSLLQFNNQGKENRLVLTTHSPYVVSYLTIAVQGKHLHDAIIERNAEELLARLAKVVPLHSLVDADEFVIYQADEMTGSIEKLPMSGGIPSDHNYLNESLREGNDLFDQLLDIEEALEA
ncbi:ATP-binding protein [Pseudomonas siliginis]|uniref:ATP-binding protein n=1 Tax=Pseudomonas siliginis TaxID=2842346 RepID=A0ABY5CAR7_9PSED|nr:ATP-binding protein [Pseudomonas siliginis]UST82971.1 ATP-binding protein [Pseudomonas siliginis]UST88170.1 ATP-binding protein [Pseudomonas siliginis]